VKLLALDLGTLTGWALGERGSVLGSGTQPFKPQRFEGGGMRYLRMRSWLGELRGHLAFELVLFEEVRRHASTDAAHAYGGFLSTMSSWCEEQRVAYLGVPVGTIKKHWTGNGNASKDMMIGKARERGFDPCDDNEADALAILHWGFTEAPGAKQQPQRRKIAL